MLFLITNRKLVNYDTFMNVIENAIKGEVDVIILREKDLATAKLETIAKDIKKAINKSNKKVALIINSNKEVAEKINADGYHVSFNDLVNGCNKFEGLLGVSIHSIEEAVIAEKNGVDYLLASHIYPTKCKAGLPPKGIDFIKKIKMEVNVPVIALGGINPQNAESVISSGADGIAVMAYIMSSDNPYHSTLKIKKAISKL